MSQTVDVEAIRQAIHDAGLRATPARIATMIMLYESSAPLTHAEVAEGLAKLRVDKATAFRNLNDMTDAGLLRRTELEIMFGVLNSSATEVMMKPRIPFLCVDCGKVTCLNNVQLTAGSR